MIQLRLLILILLLPLFSVGQKAPKIKKFNAGEEYQIKALDFLDEKTGYAVATRLVKSDTLTRGYYQVGVVLKTESGGKKWEELFAKDNTEFRCVDFMSDGFGVIGGTQIGDLTGASLFYTEDAGLSWSGTVPRDVNKLQLSIDRVQLLDDKTVIAIGNFCWRSNDRCKSWFALNVDYLGVKSAHFVDHRNGFAVGAGGNFAQKLRFDYTTDGGISWKKTTVIDGRQQIRDVFFASNGVGFILLSQSRLYRTENSGETWDKVQLKANTNARKVYFINEKVGFIIGLKGAILMSTDGGAKWKSFPIEHGVSINGICFVDHKTGFVAGSNGNVFLLKF